VKISELAKRTGVAKQTIHYYIREGVLRKPRKTGKNTADYNENYVEQIQIIKALQDDYFLPLSVIRKVLRQVKKLSTSEKSAFFLLSDYFRPLDRLLTTEISGREAFRKVTGLGRKYLAMYEKWGVITPEERDDALGYSQDDVIIGKLIVKMDQLGFGPKDGTDPEDLRRIADFVREYVIDTQKAYYEPQMKPLSSEDFLDRGSKFTEVMSLYFYHVYRKLFRENYTRLRKSIEADASK
jgi:DNA-binding transcriptional MerR regulator